MSNVNTSDCMDLVYPFQSHIPWRDIVVEVPLNVFNGYKMSPFLASFDKQQLVRKRNLLKAVKELLIYDWTGRTYGKYTNNYIHTNFHKCILLCI